MDDRQTQMEWRRDGFLLSTDKRRLDMATVHAYLTRSYWSPGIPRHVVIKAMQNSLCFGLYVEDTPATGPDSRTETGAQIGYARVISDCASFAYLADVFVLPAYQGRGLGRWMIGHIVDFPLLHDIRAFLLATRDAQGLYAPFGFQQLAEPGRLMAVRYEMAWYKPELAETGMATPPMHADVAAAS